MNRSVRHVVVLTYGEPPTASFSAQLKYSWRILLGLTRAVAPIPVWVLPMIALSRARSRVKLWTGERYNSPLEPITRAQAKALAEALEERDKATDWRIHVAYEFRDPLLTEVLNRIPEPEPVDVLPMYVADSAFTHEISRQTIARWMRRRFPAGRPAPVRVLTGPDEEAFAEVAAAYVSRQIRARGAGGPDWALVLAAHGTLLNPPRPIETGRGATECVAEGIGRRCAESFGMSQIGWLNHVYGGQWTEPPADGALQKVVDAGYQKVVYFPFGFSADNAESELEGRMALRTQPRIESIHLRCVNDAPDFIAALARSVIAAGTGGKASENGAKSRQAREGAPAAT